MSHRAKPPLKNGGDCVILKQVIGFFDAAVRYIRKLRFSVGVFFNLLRYCLRSPFLSKQIRVSASFLMMFLLLCSCSSRAEEPVLEPVAAAESGSAGITGASGTAGPGGGTGQTSSLNDDNIGNSRTIRDESSAGGSTESPAGQSRPDAQELLTVHVCGEVRKEGVYTLPAGSRMLDAIEAAGGFSEEADRSWLNLAMEIGDAWQIRVPSLTETGNLREQQGTQVPGDTGTPFIVKGDAQAGELSGDSSRQSAGTEADAGRINLNTASKEELMKIPGVGEAKAQRIIEYREQNGRFESVEDLMKVPGIKNASFQKMKDYITV